MNDIIRKAVELADGFDIARHNYRNQEAGQYPIYAKRKDTPNWFLDALAAQLVRQVDALPSPNPDYGRATIMGIYADAVSLVRFDGGGWREWEAEDGDRTMNTIKAIVDSKVLDDE